jgi:hypothetical protein
MLSSINEINTRCGKWCAEVLLLLMLLKQTSALLSMATEHYHFDCKRELRIRTYHAAAQEEARTNLSDRMVTVADSVRENLVWHTKRK